MRPILFGSFSRRRRSHLSRLLNILPFWLDRRRLAILFAAYALALLPIGGLVWAVVSVQRDELRTSVRNMATLLAQQIDARDLEAIHTPEDMDSAEFRRVLARVRGAAEAIPDVRYVYTLRRSGYGDDARWYFVVDAQPWDVDLDGDGIISPDEVGAPPGMEYEEASDLLNRALNEPVAEPGFYSDAWGTHLSAYAPIIDPRTNLTAAVLGVDISRDTVRAKELVIYLAALLSAAVLVLLVTTVFAVYFQKSDALNAIRRLEREVRIQHDTLSETVLELRDRERIINHDLAMARDFQQRFLPREFPFRDRLRFAAHYRACKKVGGDLFDVLPLSDRIVVFYMADASGHGVSAALVTAVLKVTTERYIHLLDEPIRELGESHPEFCAAIDAAIGKFMDRINVVTCELGERSSFITFILGVLDTETGELHLANAGHNPPVVRELAGGGVHELGVPPNFPLGIMPGASFELFHARLDEGAWLAVYTDGITERMNAAGEEYGPERLLQLLESADPDDPAIFVEELVSNNNRFAGFDVPDDDQALLVIERRQPVPVA